MNNEELSELRLSEIKLRLENNGLRDNVQGLREDIKELLAEMVVLRQLHMKNKDEIDTLRRLVQTKESKVEANEKKRPEKPLKLKSKNYTRKDIDDSKSPASKYVHDNSSNISIFPLYARSKLFYYHLENNPKQIRTLIGLKPLFY